MVISDEVPHAAEKQQAMNETLIPAQTHLEFKHTLYCTWKSFYILAEKLIYSASVNGVYSITLKKNIFLISIFVSFSRIII